MLYANIIISLFLFNFLQFCASFQPNLNRCHTTNNVKWVQLFSNSLRTDQNNQKDTLNAIKMFEKFEITPSPEKEILVEWPLLNAGDNKRVQKGSIPEFALPGDSTEETPLQRSILLSHFAITSLCLMSSISSLNIMSIKDFFPLAAVIASSVILGDFATGVFHWATDNYGNIKTPVFGAVCAAFQGHHISPWTITFRSFANNVYKICYATIPVLFINFLSPLPPLFSIFLTLFTNWWMLSQEFHKYSHYRNTASTPPLINFLQRTGLILSKKTHGLHHSSPFEGNYCILNGMCNKVLDDSRFFRYLEIAVYKLTGNKPNTWLLDASLESATLKL